MSITVPVYDKSDPRSDKLYPFHLPLAPEWEEQKDIFGTASMTAAGAGMFLKNPIFVWGSLIMSVVAYVNQQPLRAPKDSASPLVSLGMSLVGVFASNMPRMMLPLERPGAGVAVPVPSAATTPVAP